jgi:hypothetical protein
MTTPAAIVTTLTGPDTASSRAVIVTDALGDGPVYSLYLQARPGTDGVRAVRALRALLKISLRTFGLRCLSVREVRQ